METSSVATRVAAAAALALAVGCSVTSPTVAREQIRIVGSSTVYPFTTAVAEQFGRASQYKTPVVDSSGTGGGMKIFCDGVGVDTPDMTNASRRIKKGEFELCQKNGVKDVVEINIGFDGLTLAASKGGPKVNLTLVQLFLALAEKVPDKDGTLIPNPYRTWAQIDPSLPNVKIEVLGPPPTSGTRDSLHELFMEKGAEQIPALKALKEKDPKAFENAWKSIRRDGAYVEAGENDNVIVQKLEQNPDAFGVFGYSFLEENQARLRGVPIDGVTPEYENITSGKYKGARRLYVYLKKAHVGLIPGLEKFAAEYVSPKAIGPEGYLSRKGLVTLPKEEAEKVRKSVLALEPLRAGDLK